MTIKNKEEGSNNKTEDNKPTYKYNTIENEKTNLGDFERFSLRVVTDEKLNKEQIETLLDKPSTNSML